MQASFDQIKQVPLTQKLPIGAYVPPYLKITAKQIEQWVCGLPVSALAALVAHRQQQGVFRQQYGSDYRADLDLIFANPDGTPLRPDSISSSVSLLFKRLMIAKPKGAALHLLRHRHGSHMLASGVPLMAVSARLGHSSVRVTADDVYAHARDQRPRINRILRPRRHRDRPHASVFADQIDNAPAAIAHLDVFHCQSRQFRPT